MERESDDVAFRVRAAASIIACMGLDANEVSRVVEHERRLLDPRVRRDASALLGILHPDFTEYGASGRVWTRESAISALTADPAVSGRPAEISAVALADDVVLVTYRLRAVPETLRSSIWVRDSGQDWRLRFHQGTVRATATRSG